MKRRICYVSGTRADFGLIARTLRIVQQHPDLDVSVCVTGMHLSSTYGNTVTEIEKSGLPICARIPVDVERSDGAAMASALAHQLLGLTSVFQREKPDLVLVLGDRGEMLAGALAAVHLNLPVAHIHGGERSGTIDESVRHAISKLAHYHFTATEEAQQRLIRMGETPAQIFVTGAPGLDGLADETRTPRGELCRSLGLQPELRLILLVYHPVLQTADSAGAEFATVMKAALKTDAQIVCLLPNADAGAGAIRAQLVSNTSSPQLRVIAHFPRTEYLSWLATADVMLGNSSSGIIEAATFGTPVVNVGERQNGRARNLNTRDVPVDEQSIAQALEAALMGGRYPPTNIYGDGRAGQRIVELISSLPLTRNILHKNNAY